MVQIRWHEYLELCDVVALAVDALSCESALVPAGANVFESDLLRAFDRVDYHIDAEEGF